MATLFSAMVDLARLLRTTREGAATGGSATTLVDSLCAEISSYFDRGTLFVLSGASANKSRVITSWVLGTSYTFTVPTLTTTVSAGDRYIALTAGYSREALVNAINSALADMGPLTQYDATVDAVADQEQYDLPAGVRNLVRVEVATNDADPFAWKKHFWWAETPDDHLEFTNKPPATAGKAIRIWYNAPHAAVSADTDTVSPFVHPMRLAWTAAYYAALNRMQMTENDDPLVAAFKNEATQKMLMMKAAHPIQNLTRDPIIAVN